MKITHKWLVEFIPTLNEHLKKTSEWDVSAPPFRVKERGQVDELLTMAGIEVEKADYLPNEDILYEINITPNRGDCLSVLGIARELSAITGCELKKPEVRLEEESWDTASRVDVRVEEGEMCPRYAARVIEGVTVGDSPPWLRERLEAVGIRSVNNVVDVTNYVLMELGQPLHAFDLDRLSSPRIIVRRARAGEEIVTIDGQKRSLGVEMLVIADESGPVAVAGVMGGHETEVSETTARVLLECACFEPRSVRKSAKGLNLASESSYRFERGVDFDAVPLAIDRAAGLIAEIAGGEVGRGRVDVLASRPARPAVRLGVDALRRTLGKEYGREEAFGILRRLSFSVEVSDGVLSARAPSFRNDIEREADLIEEVARISGYGSIPATLPEVRMTGTGKTARMLLKDRLGGVLAGLGIDEVITYSFISPEDFDRLSLAEDDPRRESIEIVNPVSGEYSRMRTTMLPGLLRVVQANAARGRGEAAIFEMGRVYERGGEERERLGIALMGDRWGGAVLDFFSMKGVVCSILGALRITPPAIRRLGDPVFHPGQSAAIGSQDSPAALFGRVHPRVAESYGLEVPVYAAELDIEVLENMIPRAPRHAPPPKYPSVRRDIAMIVDDDLPYGRVEELITGSGFDIIREVKLFDLYRGEQIPEGKKGIAVTVIYRSDNSTLTDKEVNETHQLLCKLLEKELPCTIRKE